MILRAIFILLLVYASYTCHSRKSTTTVFSDSYIDIFVKNFDGHCTPFISKQNWQNVNISETNYFNISSLRNPANISSININVYQSSGSSYIFQTKSLILHKIKFKVYLPIWANKSKVPKGVVIYYHPTLFGVRQVPTNYNELQFAIASLYANNGYVIVFPNYIGYDQNSSVPHPYVMYIAQNIQSAIVCLNDISQELRTTYNIQKINLISVGYSEGAAYSITMNAFTSPTISQREKLNDFYTLKGSVGLQGPYDLLLLSDFLLENQIVRGGKFKIWQSLETTVGKPSLTAMALRSMLHYQNASDLKLAVNNISFYQMKCLNLAKNCSLPGVADLSQALKAYYQSLEIAKKIFQAGEQREGYNVGLNQIWRLFNKNLLEKFRGFLNSSSALYHFKSGVQSYVFSLEYDSLVSPLNLENLTKLHTINKTIFPNQNHHMCKFDVNGSVDHQGGELLANVFALAFANNLTSQIQN